MLGSISNSQPVVHSRYAALHNEANAQLKVSDIEKTKDSKDKLQSEGSKLTQKATQELNLEDQKKIQQLKSRDLEVKAHEQAHLSAAGSIAVGGASFTYTTGPNGVRYATGGEVSIDTSPVAGDPAATLRKADAIRRAALAPAKPSSQDQLVAGNATQMASTARTDLIKLELEQDKELKEAKKAEENDETASIDDAEKNSNSVESIPKTSSPGSLLDISV